MTTKNLIWEIRVGGGEGGNKKTIAQKGGLGQFPDLREAWSERGSCVFEGG